MKTLLTMKVLAFALILSLQTAVATDLIVEEAAVLPNYSSIQAAVDAAAPGDRIFIKNKGQNIPWIETVTIDRPLSLLPLDTTDFWLLTGNIVIDAEAAYFSDTIDEVNIIGAYINAGSITSSSSTYTSGFVKTNIMGNFLGSGNIDLDDTYYHSTVAGNQLNNGSITILSGAVIGNQVSSSIAINDLNVVLGDTVFIVGNRILNASNGYPGQLYLATNELYYYVANNYIRYNGVSNASIRSVSLRSGGQGGHTFWNNSIESGGSYTDGINFPAIGANTFIRIENNVFYDRDTSEFGSNGEYVVDWGSVDITAVVIFNYNIYKNFDGGMFDYDPVGVYALGNTEATDPLFDPDDITGECASVECIDQGSDDIRHTDLDLTRNDRGTSGGSFNYSNFWPILTGGARVYLVRTPRTVVEGTPINVSAGGYDR